MFSKIFINRPRLAMVLSLVLMLAGVLSIGNLPVEEYPNITPPSMYVFCTYAGASSEVIRDTVAFPIEEEINGLMTYDREENKFVEEVLKEVHRTLYQKFEEIV